MDSKDLIPILKMMLRDFAGFAIVLGGLEFFGYSDEFKELVRLCHDFASDFREQGVSRKAYLFLDSHHGKTSLARATELESKSHGLESVLLDGTAGVAQKYLRDVRNRDDLFVIVDGLPDSARHRQVTLEHFNSLSGRALLFAAPDYFADANLDSAVPRLRLPHVDSRPVDKLAWIVGLIRESLRDDTDLISDDLQEILNFLPVKALVTLSKVPLETRIKDLHQLAAKVGEAIRLCAKVSIEEALAQEDLAIIFMEFYSPATTVSGGFRVWVEGESDARLLRLVVQLVKKTYSVDTEEGLSILPLGKGRQGGTSKAPEVVISERTRRNKDLFLFDFDAPGKHMKEELEILGQDVILLDPKLSCSRSDAEVEIEDFISLSLLDSFYQANIKLRPEKEVIRYKAPATRRIVVNGADKEVLLDWLEKNASLRDLENLSCLLAELRSRFALKIFLPSPDLAKWKKRLEEEWDISKHLGNRPTHWDHVLDSS